MGRCGGGRRVYRDFVREEWKSCRAISGKAKVENVPWCQSKGKTLQSNPTGPGMWDIPLNDLDICKVDMRFTEVERPVALGILLYLCVPKRMYLSRGYRKEVNSIISRTSGKKKLCTEKMAWQDSETTVASYFSIQPPGLWEMLIVSCSRHALVMYIVFRRDP